MATYFISDLHLAPDYRALKEALFSFIDSKEDMDSLYILGDFFDAWIGDDEDHPFYIDIIARLKALSDGGLKLFFMHGNRDFLVGEHFCTSSGSTLLKDPTVVDLYGKNVLLMHGDSLCTTDQEYMAFRAQVRNPQWQAQVLSLPLDQRRAMAAQLRSQSKSMNSNKAEDIMDVNQADVEAVLREHGPRTLIHGHTHRPACHDLDVDDRQCERIVLGDWGNTGWYIRADENSLDLTEFSI